ncbi:MULTISPECIES: hypothetical protein [Psychrobacter]|uniref:hypothetical protein n=1 Tax=Psychrobacter TaxID=497 RepID=UPI0004707CC6|nr:MULTISPECIES: hypothetical protein [Psychrobacter]MBZ1392906.1 hypothetical protein [Psychrobacter pacificensis]
MKLKKTLMVTPLLLLSISAIAGMGDINGNTKCTIVDSISKKKVIAKSCTYDGAVGGSMSYAISQLNFKLPNGSTYRTVNNATFDFDKNGNVQNLKESISVNGKAAEVINLHHKTFKKISDKEIESRYEKKSPNLSDVLQCFKYIKKDTAFCVPYEFISSIS